MDVGNLAKLPRVPCNITDGGGQNRVSSATYVIYNQRFNTKIHIILELMTEFLGFVSYKLHEIVSPNRNLQNTEAFKHQLHGNG